MYLIRNYCPAKEGMAAHSFFIELWPQWKEAVARSGIDQLAVQQLIANHGNDWLDACGYDAYYDPERPGFDHEYFMEHGRQRVITKGPGMQRLYQARSSIRVDWGEWGPHHIHVPGSATGLDIVRDSIFRYNREGVILSPHNIDCWSQKNLIMITFTKIAECVVLYSTGEPFVRIEESQCISPGELF